MFAMFHKKDTPVYTIRIAAELLDVHPRTLRIYEEEGLICPKRTKCRYRLYSQDDIARIKEIMELMDEWSLNLSAIKAMFAIADKFDIEIEKMIDKMLD